CKMTLDLFERDSDGNRLALLSRAVRSPYREVQRARGASARNLEGDGVATVVGRLVAAVSWFAFFIEPSVVQHFALGSTFRANHDAADVLLAVRIRNPRHDLEQSR